MRLRNRIISIVLDDRAANPIGNEPVMSGDEIVGRTTSAAYGFRVNAPVALARIDDGRQRNNGERLLVDIAGKLHAGRVTTGPVFDPVGHRMKSVS